MTPADRYRQIGKADERCRYVASLYCKLGTLTAVADEIEVTPERVRQVMNEGHRNGWCQYRPSSKQSACNAVSVLPVAIKQARSRKHLSLLCGLDEHTGKNLFRAVGLSPASLESSFYKNKRQFFFDRLMSHARRLGVGDTLNTSVLQADKQGKAAYVSALRYFRSIRDMRRYAGISSADRRSA